MYVSTTSTAEAASQETQLANYVVACIEDDIANLSATVFSIATAANMPLSDLQGFLGPESTGTFPKHGAKLTLDEAFQILRGTSWSLRLPDADDLTNTPAWRRPAFPAATQALAAGLSDGTTAYSDSLADELTRAGVTDYNGSTTVAYAITSGSLPTGLSLAGATGVISGTIDAGAENTTYTLGVSYTDAADQTATGTVSIAVTDA